MVIKEIKDFLEGINRWRDRMLSPFIKKYWPRQIVPNHLTVSRIILSIVCAVLLFSGLGKKIIVIPLCGLAMLTDLFDGSIARVLNKTTKIGVVLDPIADRALIIPLAVYILHKNYLWLLIVLLCLEAINALATLYYKTSGVFVSTNIFGKTKMVLQSIAFILILFTLPVVPIFVIIILWVSASFIFADIFFKGAEFITIKKSNLLWWN